MLKKLSIVLCLVALISSLTTLSAGVAEATPTKKTNASDSTMGMHHMHTMIDHGFTMALQGANLVMLSEMKMAPGIDEITLAHGNKMMADGKSMIQQVLSGEHMSAMHKQGLGKSPVMKYTHELAKAMLTVIDELENMKMGEMTSPESMKMHHMHIALNHALEMAAEGADMIMMGQMKMAKGMDKHSVEHGKQMLADAQNLCKEIMTSSAMSEMHAAGLSVQASEAMSTTHKLAEDERTVLDLLANMPSIK